MVTETAENGHCTMQWEGHSFFLLGIGKGGNGDNGNNGWNDNDDDDGKDDGNDGNPFSLPCSCAVKILKNSVKLSEEYYLCTILVAHSNICATEPVCFYCIFGQISLG